MSKKISITYAEISKGQISIKTEDLLSKQTLTRYSKTLPIGDFYQKYIASKIIKKPSLLLESKISDNNVLIFKNDISSRTNDIESNYQLTLKCKEKIEYHNDETLMVIYVNSKDYTSLNDVKGVFSIKKRVISKKIKTTSTVKNNKKDKDTKTTKDAKTVCKTNKSSKGKTKKGEKKRTHSVDMGIIDDSLLEDNELSLLLLDNDNKQDLEDLEDGKDDLEEVNLEEEDDKKDEEEEEGDYDLPDNSEEEGEEEEEEESEYESGHEDEEDDPGEQP